jgi:threonine aldolase
MEALLNHLLVSLSSLTKQKISPMGKVFPTAEILEILAEPQDYENKIPLHIDGDPLTYLPAIIRKSTKTITIYS